VSCPNYLELPMQADIIERSLQLDVRKICHPLKDLETTLFMRFLMMTVKLMILMIQTMTNLLLRIVMITMLPMLPPPILMAMMMTIPLILIIPELIQQPVIAQMNPDLDPCTNINTTSDPCVDPYININSSSTRDPHRNTEKDTA
jgi:hypothetical protein